MRQVSRRRRNTPCASLLRAVVVASAAVLAAVAPAAGAAAPAPLTSVSQVAALSEAEARAGTRVEVAATVLYSDPEWHLLFAGDGAAVVFVDPLGLAVLPRAGTLLNVEGRTGWLRGAPAIVAPRLGAPKPAALPPAPLVPEWTAATTAQGPQWVSLRGVVRSVAVEAGRARVRLAASGQVVEAQLPFALPVGAGVKVDSEVELRGVAERAPGPPNGPQLWVPAASTLEARVPAPSLASLPIAGIAELRLLQPGSMPHRVRIAATVVRLASPRSFVVEDASGRIEVELTAGGGARDKARVEVAGFLEAGPDGPILVDSELRTVGNPATASGVRRDPDLPPVRSVAGIRSLSREEAARGRPVLFESVVTYADPAEPALFVQTGDAALYVFAPGQGFPAGSRVRVEGFTGPGSLAPIVVEPRVTVMGRAPLPEATKVSAARLRTGAEDCRRVEVTGVVRAGEIRDGRIHLQIWSEGVKLLASRLVTNAGEHPHALVDAQVRVRGVCQTAYDWRGQFNEVVLRVAGPADIEVQRPAAAPFALPLSPVPEALAAGVGLAWGHRIRVAGAVLHQEPGSLVFLRGAGSAIVAQVASRMPLAPGDRVEVAGFPVPGPGGPILEDAVCRLMARGPSPEPVRVTVGELQAGAPGADLVTVRAVALQVVHGPTRSSLVLQSGDALASATLEGGLPLAPGVEEGSTVDVTGVAAPSSEAPGAVRLLLRSPADVRVLASPPWWTPARTTAVLLALAGVLALALAWVMTLRRQVRSQTAALREHAEREAGLEREYLGRLEALVWERTHELEKAQQELVQKERLATLGRLTATVSHELRNPLATIRGSVFLVSDALKDPPALVQRALRRAEQNIVRCDGIIDELLEYVRVRELARETVALDPWIDRALGDVRVAEGIELERDLGSDAVVSFDSQRLLRCLINLVENASQAIVGRRDGPRQGSRIRVSSRVRDGEAVICVADDGPGIPAADRERVFEPFFSTKNFGMGLGLPTVRQIVERHGGRVDVESRPGATVFSLHLPLAEAGSAPPEGGE